MPSLPKTRCNFSGCSEIVPKGYCEKHQKQKKRQERSNRNLNDQYLYGTLWQKSRIRWLSKNPLCRICEENGRTVRAVLIDHIVPHNGDKRLFWDSKNWQSLCNDCHEKKHKDNRWGRK